jgi:hypothetical protein
MTMPLQVLLGVSYNETKLLQSYIGRHTMQSAKRYLLITGVVVGVLIVGGLILAAIFHVLLEVLYIFLILFAALLIAATLFQIYSIVMLIRTITTVRDELKPLLASVQETVGIVKDTAKTAGHTVSTIGSTAQLTSEIVVAPSVHAVAAVVAGQQIVRVFFGKGHVARRAEERRKKQMEALAKGE